MPDTYLITGGAGFIGANFIRYMLSTYPDLHVLNFDLLTYAGNMENLKGVDQDSRYTFVCGDIRDKDCVAKLFADYDIYCVIHFAAESHVDRSIASPDDFITTNINGTANLLAAARAAWQTGDDTYKLGVKFVHVSTDEVYGALGDEGYFTEETPLAPHSPYSASKASSDLLVKAYADTYKLPVNITRCSNNYGPYQFPEKMIPLMIHNAMQKRTLPVYGEGKQVRDWLYVEDHCRAIDLVLHNGRPGEIYNIGGHNERRNIELVKTIVAYFHNHIDASVTEDLIRYCPDRKGHDFRYAIDPGKITQELGWIPQTSFATGIVKTIEWYLNNNEWLSHAVSGEYQDYYKKAYGGV